MPSLASANGASPSLRFSWHCPEIVWGCFAIALTFHFIPCYVPCRRPFARHASTALALRAAILILAYIFHLGLPAFAAHFFFGSEPRALGDVEPLSGVRGGGEKAEAKAADGGLFVDDSNERSLWKTVTTTESSIPARSLVLAEGHAIGTGERAVRSGGAVGGGWWAVDAVIFYRAKYARGNAGGRVRAGGALRTCRPPGS